MCVCVCVFIYLFKICCNLNIISLPDILISPWNTESKRDLFQSWFSGNSNLIQAWIQWYKDYTWLLIYLHQRAPGSSQNSQKWLQIIRMLPAKAILWNMHILCGWTISLPMWLGQHPLNQLHSSYWLVWTWQVFQMWREKIPVSRRGNM